MLRSVLLFLAGIIVAVGVLRFWPGGRQLILGLDMVTSPSSGIRVVGGSMKPRIWPSANLTTDSKNKLVVENANAWTFVLKNVAQSRNGIAKDEPYGHISDHWTITEQVRQDANHGVIISGSGATPTSGTVTMETIDSGDFFEGDPDPAPDPDPVPANATKKRYRNKNCADPSKHCENERADTIVVDIGGQKDTYYCLDKDGKCSVYIGE